MSSGMRYLIPLLVALPAVAGAAEARLSDSDLACEGCGPARLRAYTEVAAVLGAGMAWYWHEREFNMVDWDDPKWTGRFTGEAIAYDNNEFTINNMWHPMDGGLTHLIGRSNRMSLYEAAALSILASGIWEFVLEWREKVSINDLVMTPMRGIPMGEAMFQLGSYLNSAPGGGSFAHQLAGATFGLPVWGHRLVDGGGRHGGETDALGFSARWAHRFTIGYELAMHDGGAGSTEAANTHGYGVEIELAHLRGYSRPETFSTFFGSGNFTELSLHHHFDQGEATDVDVHAGLLLAGWYAQDIEGQGQALYGASGRVAVGIAFDHEQRWVAPEDRIAVTHLPGLVLDGRLLGGARGMSLGAALHPDFAALDALAWGDFQERYPNPVVRSVVVDHGYYFAGGFSAAATLKAWWRPFELGAQVRLGAWESSDGLDRYQEEAVEDVPIADRSLATSAWVAWAPEIVPVELRLQVEQVTREGRMEDVSTKQDLRRAVAMAGLRF